MVDRARREHELARRSRAFCDPRRRARAPRARAPSAPPGSRAWRRGRADPRRPGAAGGAPRRRAGAEALELGERLGASPRRAAPRAPAPPRTGSRAHARPRPRAAASPSSWSRYGSAIQSGASLERARLPLPVRELARRTRDGASRARAGRPRAPPRPRARRRRRATPPRRARRGRARAAAGGRPAAASSSASSSASNAPGSPRLRAEAPERDQRGHPADRLVGPRRTRRAAAVRPRPSAPVDVDEREPRQRVVRARSCALGEGDVLPQVLLARARARTSRRAREPSIPSAPTTRSLEPFARASSRLARGSSIPALDLAGHHVRRAGHVERRTRATSTVAERPARRRPPSAPGDTLALSRQSMRTYAWIGVGARELAAGRQPLEQLDRAPARLLGLGVPAAARMNGIVSRDERVAVAAARRRARGSSSTAAAAGRRSRPRKRPITCGLRVRSRRRSSAALAAPDRGRVPSARAYCAAASRCELAAAAARAAVGGVPEHRLRVAGLLGVVREPRDVAGRLRAHARSRRAATAAGRAAPRSRPRAAPARAGRRRRRRPRAARPTSRHASRCVELVGRDRLEQPELDSRGHHRDRPRAAAARPRPSRRDAREHGVANGLGQLVADRPRGPR